MLVFAASAAVPVVIALWASARAVAHRWAAIEILSRAIRRTSASRRATDWFFIAIRAAMLVLVALAAARPLVTPPPRTGSGPAATAGPRRGVLHVAPGEDTTGDSVGQTPLEAAMRSMAAEAFDHRVVTPRALSAERLDGDALVVLADGAIPDRAASAKLASFVQRGGSLVVLFGPESTAERGRETLSRMLFDLAGIRVPGVAACDGCGLRLSLPDDQDVAIEGPSVFHRAVIDTAGGISDATGMASGPTTVLASTTPSNEPIAVAARVGRGIVGVFGIPLSLPGIDGGRWVAGGGPHRWSDLAAWPVFLPFVERTILPLARAAEPVGAGPVSTGDAVREWLARTNLPGLLLTAALGLAVVDPLAAFALRRPLRGSTLQRGLGIASRLTILLCLLLMLSGWRRPSEPVTDDVAVAARTPSPSLRVWAPRLVWLGDTAAIDVAASLPTGDASGDSPLTAKLVGSIAPGSSFGSSSGEPIATAVLVPDARDDASSARTFRGRIHWRPSLTGAMSGRVQVVGGAADPPDAAVAIRVIDEPLRVLLIDRGPRFDHFVFERSTGDDRRFRVTSHLQSSEDRSNAVVLPASREAWNRFDAVVLGPLDPTRIGESSARGLVEAAVEDGVGIVWTLDGTADLEAIAASPLRDLLPVRGSTPSGPATSRRTIALAVGGRMAWWLALDDDPDRSLAAWRSLPEISSVTGVTAARPTAIVLATVGSPPTAPAAPSPFILSDRAGRASIVAVLGELWRLRQGGRAGLVDRLARQLVLAAAESHAMARLGGDGAVDRSEQPAAAASNPFAETTIACHPAGRPLWNHPALLAMLLAACASDWWLRARLGGP